MSIYSLSLIHYAMDMRIWSPRAVHYGMGMKAKKGGIESGYGARIKIILPSQKLRKLRTTERQVPTVFPESDGSTYSPTDLISGPRLRQSETVLPIESTKPQGSPYSPTDLITGPRPKPTGEEDQEKPESEGSPYSPTGDIQFQRVLRPGKSQI